MESPRSSDWHPPTNEAAPREAPVEIPKEIERTLRAHVVDIPPGQAGQKEVVKKMSDDAIGVVEASVTRPDPPLLIKSARLPRGTSLVLIGANGAGKSTLFDALMERGAFLRLGKEESAVVHGKPIHDREALRIARLDQEELLGAVNEQTAGEVLGAAASYFKAQLPIDWEDIGRYERNLKNQEAHQRVNVLMDQIAQIFEMKDFLGTKVGNLSGGERTKLALFMVLLSEADVLLLDEPTNHLDLRSITQLTTLFQQYKNAGAALVSVSHVDWFLNEAGQDGVLEITWNKAGRTLTDSRSPYEKFVKNPQREEATIITGDIPWLQVDYGYKRGAMLVSVPGVCTIPDSPLIRVDIPAIYGGETTVLVGDNGTGKTKLMEAIVTSSRDDLPRRQKGVQAAYLPQFWPEEVARGTLKEFFAWVKEQASPHSRGSAAFPDQPPENLFLKLANELKFGGKAQYGGGWMNRSINKFSVGEQRLLWFLSVASLRGVDMLVLDEPTNHMDRQTQGKITKAIESFPGAVLLSTHDRNLLTYLSLVKSTTAKKQRPRFFLLKKTAGKTRINPLGNPVEYLGDVVGKARIRARQFKI